MLKKLLNLLPVSKYKISGNSMCPTFKPGATVLVSRLPYLLNSPKTSDIVTLKDPKNGKVLIKRITKIEKGKFFVLGDNKNESTDSRVFGWISKNDIIGKVIYISKHK